MIDKCCICVRSRKQYTLLIWHLAQGFTILEHFIALARLHVCFSFLNPFFICARWSYLVILIQHLIWSFVILLNLLFSRLSFRTIGLWFGDCWPIFALVV